MAHPCQVQLSRQLARRGHDVVHQFCGGYATARGPVGRLADDPDSFRVEEVAPRSPFARYSPLTRIRQEIVYGLAAARALIGHRPDAIVLSNVPLVALTIVVTALRLRRMRYVLWLQDVHSVAISSVASRRLGAAGKPVAWLAERLERRAAHRAAAVIAISEVFRARLDAWGIAYSRVTVIPNWAPIDLMPVHPRDNAWRTNQPVATDRSWVLYTGTLGLKHDPSIIVEAAAAMADTQFVVVSEGRGRVWLEEQKARQGLQNLTLLDYQPYELLPEVLGSADVLLALLERDASEYSVPSKVLNYLCAARPVLAVMPPANLVAQTVADCGAGYVVDPAQRAHVVSRLRALLDDARMREEMGRNGREYAERTFCIDDIGAKFERILHEQASVG
jgi:glycosyltransferase involved in cell wall biosynthesis